jgi:glutaredoxin 3
MPKQVTLYHSPVECSVKRGKSIFRKKKIAFPDRDITQNASALADLQKLTLMTTPVILINGEVIVGFDIEKLDGALRE